MSHKVWINRANRKKKSNTLPADPENWEESLVPGAYHQLVCDRCQNNIKDGETVVIIQGEHFHPLCVGKSG